jgi:hypothetical protein
VRKHERRFLRALFALAQAGLSGRDCKYFRVAFDDAAVRVIDASDVTVFQAGLDRGRVEVVSGFLNVPPTYRLQTIVTKLRRDDAKHAATCSICDPAVARVQS